MGMLAKSWWCNCLGANLDQADGEVLAIDAMEDSIAPLDDTAVNIRRLIACLELCHQKAERRVGLIIEAIGSGQTSKRPGKRPRNRMTVIEQIWQECCDVLSAWCTGDADNLVERDVAGIPARKLLAPLGERTPLRKWQVERVIERIKADLSPSSKYHMMMCDLGDYGEAEAPRASEHYRGQEESLEATRQAIIHDTEDGRDAQVSLALAIDLLMPCNWNFIPNLITVLRAIGGDLFPDTPLALCARNIALSPIHDRMKGVAATLEAFSDGAFSPDREADADILATLGEPTPVERWLAASLSKTVRLQMRF